MKSKKPEPKFDKLGRPRPKRRSHGTLAREAEAYIRNLKKMTQ